MSIINAHTIIISLTKKKERKKGEMINMLYICTRLLKRLLVKTIHFQPDWSSISSTWDESYRIVKMLGNKTNKM